MRSRAASARWIRSTARSRSSIGGPSFASRGVRKPGMSRSARPRGRRICATRLGIPSGPSPPTAPTDRGMIQRRCAMRLMTIKYPAWVCGAALFAAACAPQAVAPTANSAASVSPSAAASPGLAAAVDAQLGIAHRWYTVPDPLIREDPVVTATFNGDPGAGNPRLRLTPGGAEFPFTPSGGNIWHARIALAGLAPGSYSARLVQRVRSIGDVPSAQAAFILSQPEYVVWTLDFEGDASGDAEMANTAAIADGLRGPMR